MNTTTKRFIKSTVETFLVTFAVTSFIIIQPAVDSFLNQGIMPTKELLYSALFSGMVAAAKVTTKSVREFILPIAKKFISGTLSKILGIPLDSNTSENGDR